MIERVREAAGVELAAVDRLAVTVGPGHFTGLRSGLAAARGLALATGRPLIGITTLAAVAAGVPATERADAVVVVVLDSKRAELYVQFFAADLTPLNAPRALRPDDIAAEMAAMPPSPFVIAGDAAASVVAALAGLGTIAALSTAAARPDAAIVAALAAAMPLPAALPDPLYVHPVETTAPRARAIRA